MRRLLFISLTLLSVAGIPNLKYVHFKSTTKLQKTAVFKHLPETSHLSNDPSLGNYKHDLIAYTVKHKMNSSVCFLIDMKIASGLKRFYIYDLKNDRVVQAGLVTHGSGIYNTNSIIFSNVSGSNCTSLGKYKSAKPTMVNLGLLINCMVLTKQTVTPFPVL